MLLRKVFPALLAGAVLAAPALSAAAEYGVVDLGTLGGMASGATAIDDAGRVAGWAETAGGQRHAFVYEGGSLRDLGVLPGGTDSIATGIGGGAAAGTGGINEFGPQFPEIRQAFISREGELQPLGALYCTCDFNRRYGFSEAHDINQRGQVVGSSETVRGERVLHAFLWEDGKMLDIGGGAGDWSISRAFAINEAGQVVGDFAENAGLRGEGEAFSRRAFLWEEGAMVDLGTLDSYTGSTARAINERGQVAGWATGGEAPSRAFLWSGGKIRDLGSLPGTAASRALGLNDQGHVVGWAGDGGAGGSRAFLWRSGSMLDLNDLLPPDTPWLVVEASAINNQGQIAATAAHNDSGEVHAVLLQPAEATLRQ